jgi:homoserine dehydrogenase
VVSVPVVLCGYGNVGKAFIQLLDNKSGLLKEKYGLDLFCSAVLDINGAAMSGGFLPLDIVIDSTRRNIPVEKIESFGQKGAALSDVLPELNPGVFVECTPTDIKCGEPGLSHITYAFEHGWHVVTANKGPLVNCLSELKALAVKNSLKLKYSGATAAALPTLDVGETCLAGANILRIEGILNGTSNYILTEMTNTGRPYSEVLEEAREKGITETDPRLDVEGFDTACKTVLLANSLLGTSLRLSDIDIRGITGVTTSDIRNALESGKKIKLVGIVDAENGEINVKVEPGLVDAANPLYHVDGAEKGVVFTTDTMGTVTVTGGKSNPVGAAAAMLKDVINIYNV